MGRFCFTRYKKRPASFAGLCIRKKYLLFDDYLTEVISGMRAKMYGVKPFPKSTYVDESAICATHLLLHHKAAHGIVNPNGSLLFIGKCDGKLSITRIRTNIISLKLLLRNTCYGRRNDGGGLGGGSRHRSIVGCEHCNLRQRICP